MKKEMKRKKDSMHKMHESQSRFWEIFLSIVLVLVAVVSYWFGFMLEFMGVVFLVLAFLQLIDLKGFVRLFSKYDLIASNLKFYGYLFPFIELFLALAFLIRLEVRFFGAFTFVFMGVSAVGVAMNLFGWSKKTKVKCACLGSKIKIPLTRFTLVENIVMAIMGIMIYYGCYCS